MPNEIIKPHTFEVAKSNIQTLAHNVPPTVSLRQFPTEGTIFSWNEHNITGNEANSLLVSPLQNTLINLNSNIRSLFIIADEVYKALESLDKEYISGIIAAVRSAEVASNQAKTASSKAERASEQALDASKQALDASNKANSAQANIKRTIEALKTTVQILKDFKEEATKKIATVSTLNKQITTINYQIQRVEQTDGQTKRKLNSIDERIKAMELSISSVSKSADKLHSFLASLTHIKDVDKIWDDLNQSKEVVKGLIDTLTPFMSRVNESYKELKDSISQIKKRVDPLTHLPDVDAIWRDVEGHKTDLAGFHGQVDEFIGKVNQATERINNDIVALQQYRSVLESYQHLGDIDAIWGDVEGHKKDLAEFHRQVDNLISEVHIAQREIKESIIKMEEKNTAAHSRYEKRIKIAYYVGGSAVGLSVINYILQIIGIL